MNDKSKKDIKKVVDNSQPQKIEIFTVNILLTDGTGESYDNVIQISPIQNQNILVISLLTGEQIVYPISGNIKKYTFQVREDI